MSAKTPALRAIVQPWTTFAGGILGSALPTQANAVDFAPASDFETARVTPGHTALSSTLPQPAWAARDDRHRVTCAASDPADALGEIRSARQYKPAQLLGVHDLSGDTPTFPDIAWCHEDFAGISPQHIVAARFGAGSANDALLSGASFSKASGNICDKNILQSWVPGASVTVDVRKFAERAFADEFGQNPEGCRGATSDDPAGKPFTPPCQEPECSVRQHAAAGVGHVHAQLTVQPPFTSSDAAAAPLLKGRAGLMLAPRLASGASASLHFVRLNSSRFARQTRSPNPTALRQTDRSEQVAQSRLDGAQPGMRKAPLRQPAFGMVSDNGMVSGKSDDAAGGDHPPAALSGDVAGAVGSPAKPPELPGAPRRSPFSSADELILEFRTARGEVSETITAYGNRADTYLPLGEIARLLDLAIVISDDGRYASGWVLDESQIVTVNLRAGTMLIAGVERTLDFGDAQAMDGELYVRSGLISGFMPLDVNVDLRAQTVTAVSRRPFPFEERAAREAAREKLAFRGAGQGAEPYGLEATPYRALDVPVAELEWRAISDAERGNRVEADLRLAGDLAYLTSQMYLSYSSRDGATAARATLGRRDPDQRLLGPLRASVFELGDVTTDALAIGLRGVAGRGVTISNLAIERASVFDRIDLRGELLAGWEAELYRNNTLIGSTTVPVNGRYEFLQVPVEFGLNVFRIVLYGPQGQRREVVQNYSVGDGRLATGELRYSLSVAQRDVNVLGLTGPNFVPGIDYGRWRSTGQVSYGLTTSVTANFGAGWYQQDEGPKWLTTAGLRVGLGRLAGQLNIATNSDRGLATDVRLAGKTLGIAWTGLHAQYRGRFADELRAFSAEPLRHATEADLAAVVRIGQGEKALSVPLAARLRRIAFADRRVQTEASLRTSTVQQRLLLSNTLSFFRSDAPDRRRDDQLLGTFDVVTLSGSRTRYRAAINYRLAPGRKITRAGLDVNQTFGPDTLVKASAARLFDSRETVLGASAVHRLGPLALALDASLILPRKEHSVVFRVGLSFGRNPLTHKMFFAQPGLASGGAVAVRTYSDDNGNRRHDPGEATIAGVEVNTGSQAAGTGKDGVALVGQLGSATRAYVRVNSETLPDIAMAPDRKGFAITPRPGRIHVSQFAVDMLGEIEGTAVFGADQRGVSGLALVLLDSRDQQIARVRTGAGGTFLFEQVRPGRYSLRIDARQAERLGLGTGDIGPIVISADRPVTRLTLPVRQLSTP